MVDPFELHPECAPPEKKVNNILTLEEVCGIIKHKIIQVRTETTSNTQFDKHQIVSILTQIAIELEEKCQNY